MGTSVRKLSVTVVIGLGLLLSQSVFAADEGLFGRAGSLTNWFIPDVNWLAYFERRVGAGDPDVDAGAADEVDIWRLQRNRTADLYEFGLHYTLIDSDDEDIVSSVGALYLSFDTTTDSSFNGLGRSSAVDERVPMHAIELAFNFSRQWVLGVRGHFLDVQTVGLDVSQASYSARVEYSSSQAMSFGLGYETFESRADTQLINSPGYVAFEFDGPRVYTNFRF